MGELLPEELATGRGIMDHNERITLAKYAGETEGLLTVPGEPADGKALDSLSIVSATQADTIDRETWGKKVDFLLSVIGFAVDLANVWRFPYLCFSNGGGVFLIPYLLMVVLAGVPLFFMELALGQYYRQGAITTWGRICPLFKGIGYCVVMTAFYVDFFYNVIIAWAIHFFLSSFTTQLPWSRCDNEWNSPACYEPTSWAAFNGSQEQECRNKTDPDNTTVLISAADEYFYKKFLGLQEERSVNQSVARSVTDWGGFQWEIALCLLAVYLICYFSLWKGISMSGKVVWFTAVFPYVVLSILFIRGVTLPGAIDGIIYYIRPDISKLWQKQVWVQAATQVFFSLGPGFGVLMAFASYNPFHNNVYHDALVTSAINCATSILSGFVIFSILGYMACKSGRKIEHVATDGPGLVFVVYPEALATMPMASVWSVVFFLMLVTLGLDSSFGGSEAIITALGDEFPWIKKNREIFVALLFSLYMVIGLIMSTKAGFLFFSFVEYFGPSYGLLIAVFLEAVVVAWIYGLKRFTADLQEMLGTTPGFYWKFTWAVMAPAFLLFIIYTSFSDYKPFVVMGYKYPWWMNLLGLMLGLSSASVIPVIGTYILLTAPGNTFCEKLRWSLTPWKDHHGRAHGTTMPRSASNDLQRTNLDSML